MNKKISTFVLLSAFILIAAFPAKSQVGKAPVAIDTTKDKDNYLEMRGTITKFVGQAELDDKLPPVESALITVMWNNKRYAAYGSNNKGKVTFRLPLDRVYKVVVTKTGYVTKYFEVNTKVNNMKKGTFTFNFTVDVFEEINKLDVSVLKKPIAKVTFDPIYNQFQYDDSYTSRINFDLKKMYKNYYVLHQMAQDSIKKANGGIVPEPVKNDTPSKPGDKKTKGNTGTSKK